MSVVTAAVTPINPRKLLEGGRRGPAAGVEGQVPEGRVPRRLSDMAVVMVPTAGAVLEFRPRTRSGATSPPLDRSTSRWVRSRFLSCALTESEIARSHPASPPW